MKQGMVPVGVGLRSGAVIPNEIDLTELSQQVVDRLMSRDCPDQSLTVCATVYRAPDQKRGITIKPDTVGGMPLGITVTTHDKHGVQDLYLGDGGWLKSTLQFLRKEFPTAA